VKTSTDVFRRSDALDWLAQAPPDDEHRAEVVQAVEPVVLGDDMGQAERAGKALAHWATRDQVPNLINALGSRNGAARATAMDALARLKDERAIAPIAARLSDLSDRPHAARALEAFGPAAEKEVARYAFHKDGGPRQEADRLLKAYGTKDSELISPALSALKSADRDSRHAALEWLASAAVDPARAAEVAQALEPLIEDADGSTRDPATKALSRWGTKENVPALVKCLDSRSPDVRKAAAEALANFKDERAAPALARHLTDPFDSGTYGKALEALGPDKAEKEVVKYFFDPNNAAQQEARRITRAFGTKPEVIAAQAVAELKDGGAEEKRLIPVCSWLGQTAADEKSRPDVARGLDPLVKSSNHRVREEALKALVNWGTKDNVDTLLPLVQTGDLGSGNVRKLAIQALGNIKDDRAAPAVAARMTDFFDRETAAAALENMGPGAEKPVLQVLNTSNDAGVRLLACRVLKTVGTKDSLDGLKLHVNRDQNPEVRAAAAMAYTAIKGRQ
jgi:HEAT repeat protein